MPITKLSEEALPGQGCGSLHVPLFPEVNWPGPMFSKIKDVFLCSLFPNIVFVPLSPKMLLFPCSLEINVKYFPCSPTKTTKITRILSCPWRNRVVVTNHTFPRSSMTTSEDIIGVAPITHPTCNTNSNIQGWSLNVVKVIFHTLRNCSHRKEFAPSGSKFFPLREVPILKRGAIEENHCLIQYSLPLVCVTRSAFWLRH